MYDLVIKGGRVIDPAQGMDGARDVAFGAARSRRWSLISIRLERAK